MLLQVALNGSRDHPAAPRTPMELAAAARASVLAGAPVVHFHAFDEEGSETLAARPCAEALAAVRATCPGIPLSLSTSAEIEPDPERRLALVGGWTELPDLVGLSGTSGRLARVGQRRARPRRGHPDRRSGTVAVMRLALCIAVVAIAAGSAIGATPTAKTTPAGTLKAEIAAFNAKNYRAAYAAYTTRFKARCPYATFAKHTAQQRAMAPAPIAVRITSSHIRGARATLTYDILLGGQEVSHVTAKSPDIFVRVNGLWYDEVDAQTSC